MALAIITYPKLKDNEEYWDCVSLRLHGGYWTLVDIDDYEYLTRYTWGVKINGSKVYVKSYHKAIKHKLMHRLIMKAPSHLHVDHKYHDSLDNRKSNLRLCTLAQNCMNSAKRISKYSKYKGVGLVSRKNGIKWVVKIKEKGKTIHVGTYETEIEAALGYNLAAFRLYGEFANPNVIG